MASTNFRIGLGQKTPQNPRDVAPVIEGLNGVNRIATKGEKYY